MNNKQNIPGILLSTVAAVLFLLPVSAFALTDLEKCQNEKTALELELQRQNDKIEAKIKDLEAENAKKQAAIDAQLTDKEKELSDVKSQLEASKKEAETSKKDADEAKKESDNVKKERDAAVKNADTAQKNAETAKKSQEQAAKTAATQNQANEKRLKDLQQACNDREKALQDKIKDLEAQLQAAKSAQDTQDNSSQRVSQGTQTDQGKQTDQGAKIAELEKQLKQEKDNAAKLQARIKELENSKAGIQNKDNANANANDKEKIAALEASIEELNAQLEECKDRVRTQKERIDRLESQKKEFKNELNGELKGGDMRMPDESKGRIVININDRILFDAGSTQLKRNVYPSLAKIGRVLKKYPEHKILVIGHTDSDPITKGNFPSNKELSEARANAVLDYLLKNTNIDKASVSAKGFGERRPVAKNDTPAHKALNRRVDIIVVPAGTQTPEETDEE
jgi:chemotaxis protein MotB